MRIFSRLRFQTKIMLITFAMLTLVVLTGVIAIDRVIMPMMEKEVQGEAWRIADGARGQIMDVAVAGEEEYRARLTPIFRVRPKLLYIGLFGTGARPVLWMGEERYRTTDHGEVVEERESGKLYLKLPAPDDPVYEVVLSQGSSPSTAPFSTMRVGVSAKSVHRLSLQLFRLLFTVIVLTLAVSFFLIRWFTRMITQPVDRLMHMTQLLAAGRLEDVVEEIKEVPPCWPEQVRTNGSGERGKQYCPLLETASDISMDRSRDSLQHHCGACNLFRYTGHDELSRLTFAFQFMAAEIRVYEERLAHRYEFEERLLDACPDGIIASDQQGRIILYNKGAERLLGYPPADVMPALNARELYHPGEAQAIKKAILSEEYGGQGILLDYTTFLVRNDGKSIPVRMSATLLYRSEQEYAIVGFFHDLTELRQHMDALVEANEQLNETNNQLAGLNKRYLEMLSFVTHELKSPIANSYMSANALRQEIFGSLAPEQRIMVEAICRNLDQSIEMIRHYLDLSRIEKDELPVQPQPTRLLNEVVEPVVKGLASTIMEKEAFLRIDVQAELLWDLDPELLRGVFTNLVSNALKYGEKAGTIRIHAADLGDRCRMGVWNSGSGISKEEQEKLFQKFQRLHTLKQPSVRGTGLGLFITKTVVERHGGKIWVESGEGRGTDFIIELPRASA